MKNVSLNVFIRLVWVDACFRGPVKLVERKSQVEQFDQVAWNLLEDLGLVTSVMLFKTWHLCNLLICFNCSLILLILLQHMFQALHLIDFEIFVTGIMLRHAHLKKMLQVMLLVVLDITFNFGQLGQRFDEES